jgi:hypothetical protein
MWQACVRATPANPNHTLIGFDSEVAREEFCKQDPQVFWYVYVEDIEFDLGVVWRRGSAWDAAQVPVDSVPDDEGGDRW